MDDSELISAVKAKLTEYLDAHSQRKTPERYAILETIYSIDAHFDIEYLYNVMLNEEKFRVSRATLYNTLNLFQDAQLVLRHQFGQQTQYERFYGMVPHGHMICTLCGNVTEFRDSNLEESIRNLKVKRFNPTSYSVYVYGVCSRCASLKRRGRKNKI
jgi:Fur family ferric uptake transcriptional regulator